ncbi:MAG: hypothetical protein KDI52_10855, partial [Xanthomonadales bacterium]|nr:hypothetical protein [Xanthomonadales bacterium]
MKKISIIQVILLSFQSLMARPLDHLRMCLPLLLFIPFYYLFSEFFKMEFIQNIHPVMIIVVL